MIRKRLGRLATVFTAASMALLLVGVGATSAAQPGWKNSNAVAILDNVGPGKDAGFTVTLYNDGPGNISTLSMKADKQASYVSDDVHCVKAPTLLCNFGAQNVNATITLKVAFTVGSTGTFSVKFTESANGFAPDKGGNSRGDVNDFYGTANVTTGGGNFDGGYNVDNDTFATNQPVGRGNIQATTLASAPDLKAVTIQDGVSTYTCDSTNTPKCLRAIGEWSVLHVGDGHVGPMLVTILIYGNAVSGNPDPSTLFLLHTNDAGVTNVIDQQCTYDPDTGAVTNADCLAGVPTKVGRNYQIVAWLATNGGIRGGY